MLLLEQSDGQSYILNAKLDACWFTCKVMQRILSDWTGFAVCVGVQLVFVPYRTTS